MTLVDYLWKVGDEYAAEKFNVTPRTAQSWRLQDRRPRRKKALEIVRAMKGKITMNGIYNG